MTRNLSRRVEVGIPIQDKTILNTLKNTFSIQWKDKVKARNLNLEVLNQRMSPVSPDETNLQPALKWHYIIFTHHKTKSKNDNKHKNTSCN